MVRLMLVLAPVMCILAGIAISSTLSSYMKNLDGVAQHQVKHDKKERERNYPYKNEVSFENQSDFPFSRFISQLYQYFFD